MISLEKSPWAAATRSRSPTMSPKPRGRGTASMPLPAGSPAYAATKSAVNTFSESLRKEGTVHNVRVTVVSPNRPTSA